MKNPKLIRVDHLLAYIMMYGGFAIIILYYLFWLLSVLGLVWAVIFTIPLIVIYFFISNIAAAAADLRGPAVIVNTIQLMLFVTLYLIVYFETSAEGYMMHL